MAITEQQIQTALKELTDPNTGKDYVTGKELTVADLALFTIVHGRKALVDKAGDLPNLTRWYAAMAARPAIQRGLKALA